MSTTAISKIAPFPFKLDKGTDDAAAAEYTLKPLSGLEHMEVMAYAEMNDQGNIVYTGKSLRRAIAYGLKGWSNVFDSDGEELPFSQQNIDRLPPLDLHQIGNEIINRSQLTGAERKNS